MHALETHALDLAGIVKAATLDHIALDAAKIAAFYVSRYDILLRTGAQGSQGWLPAE
jgi:hypothetical protein